MTEYDYRVPPDDKARELADKLFNPASAISLRRRLWAIGIENFVGGGLIAWGVSDIANGNVQRGLITIGAGVGAGLVGYVTLRNTLDIPYRVPDPQEVSGSDPVYP